MAEPRRDKNAPFRKRRSLTELLIGMKKLAIFGKPRYNRKQGGWGILPWQEMNTESDIQRCILCISLF